MVMCIVIQRIVTFCYDCVCILGILYVNVVKSVWWTKYHFYCAISVSHKLNEQNFNGNEYIAMDFIHWCNLNIQPSKGYNIKFCLYLSFSHRKKKNCFSFSFEQWILSSRRIAIHSKCSHSGYHRFHCKLPFSRTARSLNQNEIHFF